MKNRVDFSLYLITEDRHLDFQEDKIRQAVEGGVTIVQLRLKTTPTRQFVDMGKKMVSFLKPFGIPLIINDRVDVAYAIKADGVHLGQSDLNAKDARAILGKKAIIGLSVETLKQGENAQNEPIDYIAASPVFSTKTKDDCAQPWGLKRLQELCSFSNYPVIAVGGINLTNLDAVWKCGVSGIAVVSAIFDSSNPKLAAQELKKKMKKQ